MFFRSPMLYYNKVRLYSEDLPFKIDIKADEVSDILDKNIKKTDTIFICMAKEINELTDESIKTYAYGFKNSLIYNPFLRIKNTEELLDLCNYMFDSFVIKRENYDEFFLEGMKRFLFMVIWQMWETDINSCNLNNIYNMINSYRFASLGNSELDRLFDLGNNEILKTTFTSFMANQNTPELITQLLLSIDGFKKNEAKEENKKNKKTFEELLQNRIIYFSNNDLIINNIFLYQLAIYKLKYPDTKDIVIINDNEQLTKFETFAYLDIQKSDKGVF